MPNAYQVVRDFEQAMCEYTGAPYAVAVDSCSNALFLSLMYWRLKSDGCQTSEVRCPAATYPSVPNAIIHAGYRVRFVERDWQREGYYWLDPSPVVDCAKLLYRGMYRRGCFQCLSFHGKKPLAIGRGGMVLCPDKEAAEWLKCARFDGRHECSLMEDTLRFPGWNCYMTPEQAARGLTMMQWAPDLYPIKKDEYPDLRRYEFYG